MFGGKFGAQFSFVVVTRPEIIQESANTKFHCGPGERPIETLRVVTAREFVALSGSFSSH